jgi:hypothetical protein
MKNDEPPPMVSEAQLFRRAFGEKARDPADVAARMMEDDERNGRWATYDFEVRLGWLWTIPIVIYVLGLIPGGSWAFGFAFAFWAIAVVVWTPWTLARVASRRPREDVTHAAALLGYGLLAWPLGLGVGLALGAGGDGVGLGLGIAFPLVVAPGGAAIVLAGRDRPPGAPSAKRALFLAGGSLSYAVVAAALAGFAVRPLVLKLQDGSGGDWSLLGLLLAALLIGLTVWPAVGLGMAAFRAWRGRLTAAAP